MITVAFLHYAADLFFSIRCYLHDQDGVQLESFCYFEQRTLISLNSYGQVLLLFIFPSFILFIVTLCKCFLYCEIKNWIELNNSCSHVESLRFRKRTQSDVKTQSNPCECPAVNLRLINKCYSANYWAYSSTSFLTFF